jgi:hypothetical protein
LLSILEPNVSGALKARGSKAQGGVCEAAETLGGNGENKGPERVKQLSALPFQGLISFPPNPRAYALGFAASRFQRSGWLGFLFPLRGLKNYAASGGTPALL